MKEFTEGKIMRLHFLNGANESYRYYLWMSYGVLYAYETIIAGVTEEDRYWYNDIGQLKGRIDNLLLLDLSVGMDQYLFLDEEYGNNLNYNLVMYDTFYKDHLIQTGDFDVFWLKDSLDITNGLYPSVQELFNRWYHYYKLGFATHPVNSYQDLYDEEDVEPEDDDIIPVDEEEIDQSYSEELWALEPGYYMSYFANLGFIVPNRFVIDVDISSRIWKYGYIVIYQVQLPLEQQWIPEAVGLVAMALAFAIKLLPRANNGAITSLDITRLDTGKYMARQYPSKKLVDLKDILAKGQTMTAFDFGNLPSPINPMLYYAASHIESIINKVLSVFTTVYLLPMNEYVGFNREDSVPVPQPEQIEQIKYMVSGYLRSKNLFSFNKIEIYNKDYVESLNLGTADNIMVFNERDPAINSFKELMKELNKFVKIEPFEAMIDDWNRQQRLNNGKTNTMFYFRRKWEMLAMKPAPNEALQNKLISEWLNRYDLVGVV